MSYSLLSKKRKELMGIAMLMVTLCHWRDCYIMNSLEPPAFSVFFSHFIIGLDLFFLLSGFGLFYSFRRAPDIMNFYRRRFVRLLPSYLIIAGPFLFYQDIVKIGIGWTGFWKDLFFVNLFKNGDNRFWFIPAIAFLYLLFPFFYNFLFGTRFSQLKSVRVKTYLLIALSVLAAVIFRGSHPFFVFFDRLFGRIPMFLLGICWGYKSSNEEKFQMRDLVLIIAVNVILRLIYHIPALNGITGRFPVYYLDGLSALLFLIPVMLYFRFANLGWLDKCFRFVGMITLEVYLTHMCFLQLFAWPYQPVRFLAFAVGLPILAGYAVHKLSSAISSLL